MIDGIATLATSAPVSGDVPPARGSEAHPATSERLRELFRENSDFVWRVLRRFGMSAADAEDGLQEVFLVVNHRLGEYEDRGATRAWLFAICRQLARAHRRRSIRAQACDDRVDALPSGDDPARAAEQREAFAMINTFLGTLSESQALAFYLVEVEGMSAPEVAAALGVGVNTVYGRLRLAHDRFETFLARRSAQEARTWR